MDASHLYSSRVYPPKSPERTSATDSFESFLHPVARLAVHPVSYCPTSDLPRDSPTPRVFPAGVLQTVFLGSARSKQSVRALFQTVTRLRNRARQGRWAVHKNTEGIRIKCKAACGAGTEPNSLVCPGPVAWQRNRCENAGRKNRATA